MKSTLQAETPVFIGIAPPFGPPSPQLAHLSLVPIFWHDLSTTVRAAGEENATGLCRISGHTHTHEEREETIEPGCCYAVEEEVYVGLKRERRTANPGLLCTQSISR